MTDIYCPWPYAAKPYMQFEFKVDRLVIWITFKYPMDTDLVPAANLFTIKVDGVDKPAVSVNWVDKYTLSFQVQHIPAHPTRVLGSFAGPSENLRVQWQKQWEPWTRILCSDVPLDWEHILDVDVDNTRVTINGTLLLTNKPILRGTYNDLDVDGVNILFLNSTLGAVIINGFSNGVSNQVLFLAIAVHSANDITLSHENGAADQPIHLHAMADETLKNQYGGWNLVCLNDHWYDISHAKHV